MPARRFSSPASRVQVLLDGERIEAVEGEPLAHALIAADKLLLARSPKLHRPHGPSCLRGGCDGCLSRVDGVPNVMTCLTPVHDGQRVETQNVVGTRDVDLLQVTDWFFPEGIDHHHLLAGIPGLSGVMQAIARRVAGLGTLPSKTKPIAPGKRSSPDALVVGAGPAGLSAASTLSSAGLSVTLCDDALSLGGSARALGDSALSQVLQACPLDAVRVLARSTAAGVFDGEVLIAGPEGAEVVRPRLLVLATGGHDGQALFEGNDLPGVFSARAAALLAARGIAIGQQVLLVGQGPFANALSSLLQGQAVLRRASLSSLVRAEGTVRVTGALLREDGQERAIHADAIAIEAPISPAFELCEQVGGKTRWIEQGFLPICAPDGRLEGSVNVWVSGEVRGVPPGALDSLLDDGRAVALAALASLNPR